ncbi:MAG: bifunctional (p)ppGpp synthetase/guanosine-3',5'-bis(diphosphate) 3'-pyrophosphohydrolase [Bacteroidales bacterium]|jgi:GTP pyrophosphokinase|nr:bifunctional (p)ppGpp synthetase/guanosine-3',5'-bis(diphosphate) 3'-pyrophosphohydrolase [Bacteroidales bacterium]
MDTNLKWDEIKIGFDKYVSIAEEKLPIGALNPVRDAMNKFEEKVKSNNVSEDDIDHIERGVQTALILADEVSLGGGPSVAKILFEMIQCGLITEEEIAKSFPDSIVALVHGEQKVDEFYRRRVGVENENFRKLLMSLAEDIRVIIILICEVLYLIRKYNPIEESEDGDRVAREASYLFAPLAHRLGLYKVKSELEDLSMKRLHRETYKEIAHKLNETKRSRDKYIADFISPLKKKLEDAGFKFTIKGRTKSIYSIWNKMRKQNTTFEHVYDLFAIRIILDSELSEEKSDCWRVYSIVTDEYQPNPKRLRDWLSIPKTNGYESLHTTVMGPQGKWVEVQIRTERMDEIAEKGFAAHFKYKGVKSENMLDTWMANVREILENPDVANDECISEFKMNLYDKEVFIFTPNGDLVHLPKGATLLDFAYLIHSNLGNHCVGGKIGGKNVSLRYEVNNGDQLEVITSATQKPKKEWLNIVKTSKAKSRIRLFLREEANSNASLGKELLNRRFKNWKIDLEESILAKTIKRLCYKMATEFYNDIVEEELDVAKVRDIYTEIQEKEQHPGLDYEVKSAEDFEHHPTSTEDSSKDDVLTIDDNVKGIDYTLAKCCNPIYGDDIFGFILSQGGIKIHRKDCPNAPMMIQRFGYRYVKARWSGKQGTQYVCTLRVIGNDDLGIVTNITSLIQKESNISMRSISVDSVAGLFQGHISLLVNDLQQVDNVIKKIKAIKGVKSVERS